MKNRILVFLVFITTILKGQSVDPETFPTVVGEIGNKNLYTNTGGEGKVAIKTIMDSVTSLSIPLNGTRVGEPGSGAIYFGDEGTQRIAIEDDVLGITSGELGVSDYSKISPSRTYFNQFLTGYETAINLDDISVQIALTNPLAYGLSGSQDFTPNITDLDYTQKIYVDTKASKLGADDIEITDFNKGVILTSPNGSRYRITVDNAGILTTTIIP